MKHIAKALASQGRNGDSELLHVTKNELQALNGLAAKHGLGSLTRNPTTGLSEANLLDTLVPILGGIGGGALGAMTGTPMGVAGGAALGSGLGSKLAGKSDQDALRGAAISGVLGGLGAYASGLGEAAPAAAAAPAAPIEGVAPGAIPDYLQTPAQPALGTFSGAPATVGAPIAPYENLYSLPPGGMTATGESIPGYTPTPAAGSTQAAAPSFWGKAGNWVGEHPMQAAILGGTAANALIPAYTPPPQKHQVRVPGMAHSNRGIAAIPTEPYGGAEKQYFTDNDLSFTQDPSTYRWSYAAGGPIKSSAAYADGGAINPARQWVDPNLAAQQAGERAQAQQQWQAQQAADQAKYSQPVTTPSGLYGQNWYENTAKANTLVQPDTGPGDAPSQGWVGSHDSQQAAVAVPTGGLNYVAQAIAPNAYQGASDTISHWASSIGFAKGGILNLRPHGQTMNPMFLRGGGDGMSDSIPAYIDGGGTRPHEPIRVATNEYIVPADAVSHLGNGSSDAGAKKLDQMVAKVRKARTGKAKQAPKINPQKYLPT